MPSSEKTVLHSSVLAALHARPSSHVCLLGAARMRRARQGPGERPCRNGRAPQHARAASHRKPRPCQPTRARWWQSGPAGSHAHAAASPRSTICCYAGSSRPQGRPQSWLREAGSRCTRTVTQSLQVWQSCKAGRPVSSCCTCGVLLTTGAVGQADGSRREGGPVYSAGWQHVLRGRQPSRQRWTPGCGRLRSSGCGTAGRQAAPRTRRSNSLCCSAVLRRREVGHAPSLPYFVACEPSRQADRASPTCMPTAHRASFARKCVAACKRQRLARNAVRPETSRLQQCKRSSS